MTRNHGICVTRVGTFLIFKICFQENYDRMKVLVDELKERTEKIKLGKCEQVTYYPLQCFCGALEFPSALVKLILLTAPIKNFIAYVHFLRVRSDLTVCGHYEQY